MKNKKLIILAIILMFIGFVWVKYIKQGKYIADRGYYVIDGSEYVESGKYYFNCDNGVFIKRVSPELDIDRIREGRFTIPEGDYHGAKSALQKHMTTAGWENNFEYLYTGFNVGKFKTSPRSHFFYKFVTLEAKDYTIEITQSVYPDELLDILIYEGHETGISKKNYLEAVEAAKNSCPDPQ